MNNELLFNNQTVRCDCAGNCTGHNLTIRPPVVGNATAIIGKLTFGPPVDTEVLQAEQADLKALLGQIATRLRTLPEATREELFSGSMWNKINGHKPSFGLESMALVTMRRYEARIKELETCLLQ